MVVYKVPLVSPFEFSKISTAIIQQRNPCSKHESGEIHTLKQLKVGRVSWNKQGRWGERRRNPVMASTPLSWEEQRDSMGTPAAMSSTRCSWARDLGKDTAWGYDCGCWIISIPNRETKPQSPVPLRPPFALGVRLQSTLPANPRTDTTELLYPWAKGAQSQGWMQGGTPWRSKVIITRRTKRRRSWPVPQAQLTATHYGFTDGSLSLAVEDSTGISQN